MAQVAQIRHEVDLSEYTTTVTGGGDLTQAVAAALAGSSGGLSVLINDIGAIYGQLDFATLAGTAYGARFYIDPNSISMANGNIFNVLSIYGTGTSPRANVQFYYNSGYYARLQVRDDSLAWHNSGWYAITDAEHYIEITVDLATGAAANDGTGRLRIDGVLQETVSGIDLFDLSQPERLRFGAAGGLDVSTSGTLYLDELVLRDDNTQIGAAITTSTSSTSISSSSTSVSSSSVSGVTSTSTSTSSTSSSVSSVSSSVSSTSISSSSTSISSSSISSSQSSSSVSSQSSSSSTSTSSSSLSSSYSMAMPAWPHVPELPDPGSSDVRGLFPRRLLLRTTEGTVIDLLDPSGICLVFPGWTPKVARLKSGGVRTGTQLGDTEHVIAGGYGNVTEEFPVMIDDNAVADRIQQLLNVLWLGENWAKDQWQSETVYLEVRLDEDVRPRYTQVISGAYQFGNQAYGDRVGFPENGMALEREPFWHAQVPGELMGPFTNEIANPSFEWWRDIGIVSDHNAGYDLVPEGWAEIVDANFPAERAIEREEYQTAGTGYALKMSYTYSDPAAPAEWVLAQDLALEPMTTYTLRFWLLYDSNLAPGQFFVKIAEPSGFVYAKEIFEAADVQGQWFYSTFTTDHRATPYYSSVARISIGFSINTGSASKHAIIDHAMITEGSWSARTWPGTLYISASRLANYGIDEGFVQGAPAYGISGTRENILNSLDVEGVPGDVPADCVLEIRNTRAWTNLQEPDPLRTMAVFKETNRMSDHTHINPEGVVNALALTGRGLFFELYTENTWEEIYSTQFSGLSETEPLNGHYRLLCRLRTTGLFVSPSHNKTFLLKTWIGNPGNVVQYDEVEVTYDVDPDIAMINLTPRRTINWRSPPGAPRPTALGFLIEAKTSESSEPTVEIDMILLGEVTDGGVIAVMDPPVSGGQALLLDSRSMSIPVTKIVAQTKIIKDRGLGDLYILAGRTFGDHAFLSHSDGSAWHNDVYRYSAENNWEEDTSYFGANQSPQVNDFEEYNGKLIMACNQGWIVTYRSTLNSYDHPRTVAGNPNLYYVQAFDGYLFFAAADSNIYRWNGDNPTLGPELTDVYACAKVPRCMGVYKHQLWVGAASTTTYVYDRNGWTVGPIVPDATPTAGIVWLQAFKDRLYALLDNGNVWRWDGSAWIECATLEITASRAANKLFVFGDELYGLTHTLTEPVLTKTADGLVWEVTLKARMNTNMSAPATAVVYCGQILVGWSGDLAGDSKVFWHVPEQARQDVPQYRGRPIQLVPDRQNRITVACTTWISETRETWFASEVSTRVSIDPHWRALRNV